MYWQAIRNKLCFFLIFRWVTSFLLPYFFISVKLFLKGQPKSGKTMDPRNGRKRREPIGRPQFPPIAGAVAILFRRVVDFYYSHHYYQAFAVVNTSPWFYFDSKRIIASG